MLDRMATKGYLERSSFHGLNLYRPLITRPQGLARLVHDFAGRVLEDEAGSVVALVAGSPELSPAEFDEVQSLVDELED
jgi:predicted transcriptional regulator